MRTKTNHLIMLMLLSAILLLSSCSKQAPNFAEKVGSPAVSEQIPLPADTAPQISSPPTQSVESTPPPAVISNPIPVNSNQNVINPQNKTNTSKNHFVVIEGFAFSPENTTIKKGDSITWVNRDSAIHTVISEPSADPAFVPFIQSGDLLTGSIYSVTFNEAGSYGYLCGIHHSMHGTILVKE